MRIVFEVNKKYNYLGKMYYTFEFACSFWEFVLPPWQMKSSCVPGMSHAQIFHCGSQSSYN